VSWWDEFVLAFLTEVMRVVSLSHVLNQDDSAFYATFSQSQRLSRVLGMVCAIHTIFLFVFFFVSQLFS